MYKKNNIQYVYLLEMFLATELIEGVMRIGGYDDAALAQVLVEYGINDA